MSNQTDNINELKQKLKSAINNRIKNEKIENSLRLSERSMVEELCLIKTEEEFILSQIEDLKNEILQMKNQMTMIDICSASEKARIECCITNLNNFKKNFDAAFEKERHVAELHSKELREKEAELEELERKKHEKFLQMTEEKVKEAIAVETECEAIERACCILTKRNKAIMIKIRRRLIEAEETRRKRQQHASEVTNKA